MPWREALQGRLSPAVLRRLDTLEPDEAAEIEEIRIRLNGPLELVSADRRWTLAGTYNEEDLATLVSALCGYTRYAYEMQLAEGYIPLPGGHRAGICGRIVMQQGDRARMCDVTSVCIRIARTVPGASEAIRPYLFHRNGMSARVLFFGPPGCGKTTLLRDAALYLSDTCGLHVGVADEREELFPAGEVGLRLDVMPGIKKSISMPMLIRAMAPDVIVTDEIGDQEDAAAILEAVRCGTGLLCSAHGAGIKSLHHRPLLNQMIHEGAFDRCIELGRHGICINVWEYEEGKLLECGWRDRCGELGHSGDGDDFRYASGLSAGRRGTGPRSVYPRDAKMPDEDPRSDPL